jgi:hypothetical protein
MSFTASFLRTDDTQDSLQTSLLHNQLKVDQSLATAKLNRHRKQALDRRLNKFNCHPTRPQSSMQSTGSARDDKSPSVSTLGELLQVQMHKHDTLFQAHVLLRNSFNSCQVELGRKDRELQSLQEQARQQLKELEGLKAGLQTAETKLARSREEGEAKDGLCRRLKSEVGHLTQELSRLQAAHRAELQALEGRLLREKSPRMRDQVLIGRLRELEDKLMEIEVRRSYCRANTSRGLTEVVSSLSKPLFGSAEAWSSPPMVSCKSTGEWKLLRLSEDCSGNQSPEFSPMDSKLQGDTSTQLTADLLSLNVSPLPKQSEVGRRRKTRTRRAKESLEDRRLLK